MKDKENLKRYCFLHDAYYYEDLDKWTSDICGDPTCSFCKNRPLKPSEVNRIRSEAHKRSLNRANRNRKLSKRNRKRASSLLSRTLPIIKKKKKRKKRKGK